ncbi:MAG: sigma-70 family RNA polymerase sigma factor [Myxococcota bacterium]|nr:sigma-70 family RNA polymerase sigma factor [Myxococcota bacterium]
MKDRGDAELMALYAGGSRAAFEELFRRYEGRAFHFFRRRISSDDRAHDLYQELFLRLHRFRDRYDPERPFAAWFFQIARHVLFDELRRGLRSAAIPLDDAPTPAADSDAEQRIDSRRELERTLGTLPEDASHILIHAKLLGRDYRELAVEMGRSADAVKQTASRAMRRLRLARDSPDSLEPPASPFPRGSSPQAG